MSYRLFHSIWQLVMNLIKTHAHEAKILLALQKINKSVGKLRQIEYKLEEKNTIHSSPSHDHDFLILNEVYSNHSIGFSNAPTSIHSLLKRIPENTHCWFGYLSGVYPSNRACTWLKCSHDWIRIQIIAPSYFPCLERFFCVFFKVFIDRIGVVQNELLFRLRISQLSLIA